MPVIQVKNRNGIIYLPMEVCRICDNQRVRLTQQLPKQTEEMIKVCLKIILIKFLGLCDSSKQASATN